MALWPLKLRTESDVLKASIYATLILAIAGIGLGIVTGSNSITFDGVYSLVDIVMTALTLFVVQLITRYALYQPLPKPLQDRFNVGFWHLEPMVLLFSGLTLMGVAVMALLNSINTIVSGGHAINFGPAIFYAVITSFICFGTAGLVKRANKRFRSDFLKLDAEGWLMSGCISGALLVAFIVGLLVQGSELEWISPYIDPAVLVAVCLIILPLPVTTVRSALRDILLMTPGDLKHQVDAVAEKIVQEEGFRAFHSYVAKVGRGQDINLCFIAPRGLPPRSLAQWDKLRDRINDEISGDNPNRWLTISFTEDEEWA